MTIIKASVTGKFNCNGTLINFKPIIDYHKLTGYFVLMHWNKIQRLFGYYDGKHDEYFVGEAINIFSCNLLHRPISIPYIEGILPTDVILYPDATIKNHDGFLLLNLAETEG